MGKKSKRRARNPPSKGKKRPGGGGQSKSLRSGPLPPTRDECGTVLWTQHDDQLNGDPNQEGFYGDDDEEEGHDQEQGELSRFAQEMKEMDLEEERAVAALPSTINGSRNALIAALDRVWSDQTISNPHGVGIAYGPKDEWMELAIHIASNFNRGGMFWQEYEKDKAMHKSTLDKLSKEATYGHCEEIDEGLTSSKIQFLADRGGSKDYVLALNCIFQDVFYRLGLEELTALPPLNLNQGVQILVMNRGEPLGRSQLQVWRGYENLALKFLSAIKDHPLIPKPEPNKDLGEFIPVRNRGGFPQDKDDEDDDEDGIFGGCMGFSSAEVEDLMSQGVKPWDDDAGAVLAALNGY